MLTFFRRIRKRLMSEPASPSGRNMTSKYLLYAIGEIALVVIGILIAITRPLSLKGAFPQVQNLENEISMWD